MNEKNEKTYKKNQGQTIHRSKEINKRILFFSGLDRDPPSKPYRRLLVTHQTNYERKKRENLKKLRTNCP